VVNIFVYYNAATIMAVKSLWYRPQEQYSKTSYNNLTIIFKIEVEAYYQK